MSSTLHQGSSEDILRSAQRAVTAIGGIVSTKDDDVPIATNAGSLRGVATVIDGLSQQVTRCGGHDCMGRSVDGLRLWVTQDRLTAERQRAAGLEARVATAEAALHAIVSAARPPAPELAMFWDWQSQAIQQQAMAQAALGAAGGV